MGPGSPPAWSSLGSISPTCSVLISYQPSAPSPFFLVRLGKKYTFESMLLMFKYLNVTVQLNIV